MNQMRNNDAKRDNLSNLQKEFGGTDKLLNALSHEFISNFNQNADDLLRPIPTESFDMTITEQEVFNVLSHLKVNKSVGPDNIPPRLLKEGAAWLCVPLTKIFNRSLTEMTFPRNWKLGKICPVPKKSRPTIKDLRPISVLSSLSKVFELLILNRMKKPLISLYGKKQHAFRPLGSTVSALIDVVDTISSSLDSRQTLAVHMTCLDLTKAFDKLQHNRLLNYLNARQIKPGFLKWLHSYLTDRRQYVFLNGAAGPIFKITSGVPQGSVMGPYLFAAFMGQISSESDNEKVVMDADDMTVIETATHSSSSSLDMIKTQITEMGLSINVSKSTQLCFNRSRDHRCSDFAASDFSWKDHVKILGFILTNTLSWDKQISATLLRASQRLYIIRTLKKVMTVQDLKLVYHSLITSLLKYCSLVYGHLCPAQLSKFERFQKRSHRIICGNDCSCTDFPDIDSF